VVPAAEGDAGRSGTPSFVYIFEQICQGEFLNALTALEDYIATVQGLVTAGQAP
jgi:hypothetical protein